MNETKQKEDYRILVTIKSEKVCVDDVLCKVFLPKRLTDPIKLFFYLTN